MSSFLAKAGFQQTPSVELTPSIRVVVVGESGVGKSALSELISTGKPQRTRSTAGCHIYVHLVQGPAPDDPKYFVEIWDVSGQPKYEQLRAVFYKQINGVILVYDLTDKGTLNKLPKWASEIAHEGSFVAPFGDELAARNIGGLPIPVLVVGNKSDRLRQGSADAGSLSSLINNACSTMLSSAGCSSWWQRGLGSLRGHRRGPSSSELAAMASSDLEPHVKGLTASAAAGKLDWELLNSFFTALWERRYKPFSGSAGEYVARFTGHPALGAAGAAAAGGGGGGAVSLHVSAGADAGDQRLDDDWV